jgi:6-phosphogluconolactonase (cycloisomerase 2 family)
VIACNRRDLLKSVVMAGGLGVQLSARGANAGYAYVGCFTTAERQGRGDGIDVYRMEPETGALTHVQHVGNLMNPSFLILSRDQRFLYSVHGDGTYASSFAVDRNTGYLTSLNRAATGGSNGVHLAIDASGKFLLVANYSTGTVGVLHLEPDGKIQDHVQLMALQSHLGSQRVEKSSSNPHQIVFDPSGRFVLVPDKGLNRVFVFHFDSTNGRLTPTGQSSTVDPTFSAPRHLAFHPSRPIIWVLNESASTATTCRWDPAHGTLQPLQVVPTLPSEFKGHSTAAEIAVLSNGRFVYSSNRGHDSIAIYSTDPNTGLLKSVGWVPTQGNGPRFISLDPSQRFLYAANELGSTIVTYRVDPETGHLTPTGHKVASPSPVTITFLTQRPA